MEHLSFYRTILFYRIAKRSTPLAVFNSSSSWLVGSNSDGRLLYHVYVHLKLKAQKQCYPELVMTEDRYYTLTSC